MCSIGGFITNKQPLPSWLGQRLAQALLFYGGSRGRQSAGVYANGKMLKKAMDPSKFIELPELDAIFSEPTCMALTHTRMPTSGGTGDEQAHPFQAGLFTTVHNGSLSNAAELRTKWKLDKDSGVDSELFASALAVHGLEKLPDFCADALGTAAVAIWDTRKLHFFRDGNPLEYRIIEVPLDDGVTDLLVFGSTEEQVTKALQHCWLLEPARTVTLPPYQLHAVELGDSIKVVSGPKCSLASYSSWRNHDDDDDALFRRDIPTWSKNRLWTQVTVDRSNSADPVLCVEGRRFSSKNLLLILQNGADVPDIDLRVGIGWFKRNGVEVYDRAMALMQDLIYNPFGPMRSALISAVGSKRVEKAICYVPPEAKKTPPPKKKKRKKDRNRNGSSAQMKLLK